MRRWETLTALAAVIFATLGSIPTSYRYVFTALAVVMIAIVGLSRLLAALARKKPKEGFDPAERAREIREQRHTKGPHDNAT